MAYAQRRELSGNRTLAIIVVAVIQFTLGYAIVTGLAYNVIKKASENLKTFDVEETPPPPEQPPPPPPKNVPEVPPPPVAMRPIVQTNVSPSPQIVTTPTPQPVIHVQAPPAPPAPPPAKITKAQSARGNLQGLFSGDDYPPDAMRNEETGRTTVRLSIGETGRVTGCSVISSSGSRSLDNATCRVLTSRARFTPAKLSNGQPTTDTYTQTIVWQLQ